MTVVPRRSSIITAPAALALRCLLSLAILSFGMGGPVRSQERDQLQPRPQAAPESQRDILILRSGGYEQGELTGCSSESCSLDGKSHRRDDIGLIGLRIAGGDPAPTIDDPLQDSIRLRSRTVLKTKLLAIDTQTVVSGQGSNPRRDVAWVYLAPPQTAPPDHAGRPIDPTEPESEKRQINKHQVRNPKTPPQPTPPSGDGSPERGVDRHRKLGDKGVSDTPRDQHGHCPFARDEQDDARTLVNRVGSRGIGSQRDAFDARRG